MDTARTYDALVCDSQTCTQCNDPVMCVECAICMGLFSKFMRKLKGNENSASTKLKLLSVREHHVLSFLWEFADC